MTPFTLACKNGHKDVVKLLVDHSGIYAIDLHAADNRGWTGFTWACVKGHIDVVKILLDHSDSKHIDLHAKDRNGKTALTLANEYGKTDVVKLLGKYILDTKDTDRIHYPK